MAVKAFRYAHSEGKPKAPEVKPKVQRKRAEDVFTACCLMRMYKDMYSIIEIYRDVHARGVMRPPLMVSKG